jgi:hypothetical protein
VEIATAAALTRTIDAATDPAFLRSKTIRPVAAARPAAMSLPARNAAEGNALTLFPHAQTAVDAPNCVAHPKMHAVTELASASTATTLRVDRAPEHATQQSVRNAAAFLASCCHLITATAGAVAAPVLLVCRVALETALT